MGEHDMRPAGVNYTIVIEGVDNFSKYLQAIRDALERMAAQMNETTQGLTMDEKRDARDEIVLSQEDLYNLHGCVMDGSYDSR